jgi:hypothetical protein
MKDAMNDRYEKPRRKGSKDKISLFLRLPQRDVLMAVYTKRAVAEAMLKLSVLIAQKSGYAREYYLA